MKQREYSDTPLYNGHVDSICVCLCVCVFVCVYVCVCGYVRVCMCVS
jgi:hypothetical protein